MEFQTELCSGNRNGKSVIKIILRLFVIAVIILILSPIILIGSAMFGYSVKYKLGYVPEYINISGTGSMYPTFPKGEGKDPKELSDQIVSTPGMIPYPNGFVFRGERYFGYELGRGDIVVVENDKIRQLSEEIYGSPSGWVKRVVGLAGDTIEIRDGLLYINGEPQKEPYTPRPRATFGQTFLGECQKITVPDGHIFILGDNRKGSSDSREIGFVEIEAVNHVLPLKDQLNGLDANWRNTDNDLSEASKINLNEVEYLDLLNAKRKEAGLKELKFNSKLGESALKRGEVILQNNDFSFEAESTGFTMEKAMREVGYSNIVWGEAPAQGYYEADELIENQFQFTESKNFLLNKDFEEIGIAEVQGEINGCPSQVIIQHFGGYIPPNYPQSVINSWKQGLNQLKEIQPGWRDLKKYKEYYEDNKREIDRINEIIQTRIDNISKIVAKMEANQWLNSNEEKYMEQDESLANEQNELAKKLNDR